MKKSTLILAAVLLFICMGCGRTMQIEVINPTDTDRLLELIEIPLDEIQSRLDLSENETFVLLDGHDTIPCQITFDRDVLFPCALNGNEKRRFEFKAGVPSEPVVKVCGAHYPERVDDICWENDIVGFRVYGFKEDKPSGYDIFTKKNTDLPVIPEMYRKALDPQARKLEDEIRKEFGKDSAARFNNRRSFHIDHGFGADFYSVGPTLGAGTSALLDGDQIVYPACYDSFEILDNGPLRFTLKLTFRPVKVGNCENIVETRYISLDLGSHFTRTEVTFEGIDRPMPIVTGIVVQDTDGKAVGDASKGYIAYPSPTMNFDKFNDIDNGMVYMGNVFPYELEKAGIRYFSDAESLVRGGSKGHILAHSTYEPDKPFVYYWGFCWNKVDMTSYGQWLEHLERYSAQLKNPLILKIK